MEATLTTCLQDMVYVGQRGIMNYLIPSGFLVKIRSLVLRVFPF